MRFARLADAEDRLEKSQGLIARIHACEEAEKVEVTGPYVQDSRKSAFFMIPPRFFREGNAERTDVQEPRITDFLGNRRPRISRGRTRKSRRRRKSPAACGRLSPKVERLLA